MENNIDKDIEILKEHINFKTQFTLLNHEQEQIEAIEHIISELETYKKIAEKLAEELSNYKFEKIICMKTDCEHIEIQNGGKCIGDKECIIDWARKEVEK